MKKLFAILMIACLMLPVSAGMPQKVKAVKGFTGETTAFDSSVIIHEVTFTPLNSATTRVGLYNTTGPTGVSTSTYIREAEASSGQTIDVIKYTEDGIALDGLYLSNEGGAGYFSVIYSNSN